jgi:hypothetical protein
MVTKAGDIETQYARSKAMQNIWKVDANGNINLNATKKNIINNRAELEKHYTPDELEKMDGIIGRIGNINVKNIARNKSEAMEFLGTISSPGLSPQNVVNAIVKPNNTINIRYMQRLLGPEMSKEVETKFVENYLMKMNQHGFYLPERAARIFNQYDTTLRKMMDPQAYSELSDLMKLNRNAAALEKIASNPSQTGQTLIGFETGKDLVRSLSYALVAGLGGGAAGAHFGGGAMVAGAISSIAVAFGPYGLAKLYLHPVGRKLLSIGYTLPAGSQQAMELIGKMAAIAGVDVSRQNKPEEKQPQAGQRPKTIGDPIE